MDPLPRKPEPDGLHWRVGRLLLPPGLGRMDLLGPSERPIDPTRVFSGGLLVRFGTKGLRCRPMGGSHHHSLKKLFQGAKVPQWLRPYVPLTFTAEGLVSIGDFWLCGGRADERSVQIRWQGELRTHPGFRGPRPEPRSSGRLVEEERSSDPLNS
jgi:tRNA(Ile)-lysidine synthetase-like protein